MDRLDNVLERLYDDGVIVGAIFQQADAWVEADGELVHAANYRIAVLPREDTGVGKFVAYSDDLDWVVESLWQYSNTEEDFLYANIGGEIKPLPLDKVE